MFKRFSLTSYFLTVAFINFIFISLAIIFYKGQFDLITFPFSDAGRAFTLEGSSNIISMLLYSSGMLLSGIVMIALAYKFFQNKKKNIFEFLLCLVGGLGFLIACFSPNDTRHNFHVVGSALVVASLWLLATNFLYEIRKIIGLMKYLSMQLILQIPIFTYAGLYFWSIDPASYILQKIAILSLLISLVYSTMVPKDDDF